jgi:hypothetical protein
MANSISALTVGAAAPNSTASGTQVSGELQHNYVVYPGDANGDALSNMQRDPLMQEFWPQLEGHHTVTGSGSSWDGEYDYLPGRKPSYEEDFAFPRMPFGPAYTSGLAIAVSSQAELNAVMAAMTAKFGGDPKNVPTNEVTLDVTDRGAPGDHRFNEFKRRMVNTWFNNGLDGKPAYPGNFGVWVTMERTLDGTGTQTIEQVVAPHFQAGKLPKSVTSVTYALNAEDFANTEALLECCGFQKRQDGTTDVWVPRKPGAKIRLVHSEDANYQGLVCRSYSLHKKILEQVREEYGEGPIHRDFGYGVSLDIDAREPKATLWLQKPPSAGAPKAAAALDSFEG